MASMTAPAAQSWETAKVPAHGAAFWDSLPDSSPAQNVQSIFTNTEVLALGLDEHAEARGPRSGWPLWVNITAAIFEQTLDMAEADASLDTLVGNGKDGGRNYAFVYQLARVKLQRGRYSEAEALAKETLPWMEKHEALGKDSPQTHRIILQAVAKQGRTDEARAIADATKALIGGMGTGRYSKYEEEEKQELEKTVEELVL